MKKYLFIFAVDTAYGEYVQAIVHYTKKEAFEFQGAREHKSPAKLSWELTDLKATVEVADSTEIGVVFDGGGKAG
jgi:FKBP-type peptidyl-prolyl cis-trans isomerase 2